MDHTTARPTSGFICLRLGKLQLALPHTQLRALEPVSMVEPDAPPASGIGWITYLGEKRPVFGVNERLRTQSQVPATHAICAVFASAQGYFGLLCEAADSIRLHAEACETLSPAMRLPDRPITGLAQSEDARLLCLSEAHALHSYLMQH